MWAIETYRHREGFPPGYDVSALGREPARGQDRQRWSETVATVRQARAALGLDTDARRPDIPSLAERLSEPPERDRGRGRNDDCSSSSRQAATCQTNHEGVSHLIRSIDRELNR